MTKMLLHDVNVWLALVFNTHLHHPYALAWLNSITDETGTLLSQGSMRPLIGRQNTHPRPWSLCSS
jgi:hypothetical protein